jgi:hypothetical protein
MKLASNLEVPSLDDYKEHDICENALQDVDKDLGAYCGPLTLVSKPALREMSICRTCR